VSRNEGAVAGFAGKVEGFGATAAGAARMDGPALPLVLAALIHAALDVERVVEWTEDDVDDEDNTADNRYRMLLDAVVSGRFFYGKRTRSSWIGFVPILVDIMSFKLTSYQMSSHGIEEYS
jgi:hypothetical protein